MELGSLFGDEAFRWIVLPLFIFFARILDVTLGTMRIVFVSKGMRYIAPLVGFFEVFIWIVAIKELMTNLTNIVGIVAYSAGFAAGNFIGLYIEGKIALGTSIVRVITQKDALPLIEHLKKKNCGLTHVDAQGTNGQVHVIYLVVRRAELQPVIDIIHRHNPNAFYTIEEVSHVSRGVFPPKNSLIPRPKMGPFRFFRKGK